MTEATADPGRTPSGVLNLLKPPGMTSHDVVDVLRRLTGVRRIGHTGTLDPGACGVLVLCVGRATRIAEFLTGQEKGYRAEFTFGVDTDSGDAYGEVLSQVEATGLRREEVEAALAEFTGEIQQVPPMVSAVKVGGRRLYERARRGESIEVPARRVEISEFRLIEFTPGIKPRALVNVECTKGTYIRALARDLGVRLGVGAHASFVLRTHVGGLPLERSLTLEEIAAVASAGRLDSAMVSVDEALADMPAVELTPSQRRQVLDGGAIPLFQIPGWQQMSIGTEVRLRDRWGVLAIGRVEQGRLQPIRVLRGDGT